MLFNEKEHRTIASKPTLYPDGYGGKDLYPPLYLTPIAADSLVWMTPEERNFKTGHIYASILGFKRWYDERPVKDISGPTD